MLLVKSSSDTPEALQRNQGVKGFGSHEKTQTTVPYHSQKNAHVIQASSVPSSNQQKPALSLISKEGANVNNRSVTGRVDAPSSSTAQELRLRAEPPGSSLASILQGSQAQAATAYFSSVLQGHGTIHSSVQPIPSAGLSSSIGLSGGSSIPSGKATISKNLVFSEVCLFVYSFQPVLFTSKKCLVFHSVICFCEVKALFDR
jgi:hypothetical protein